MRRTIWLAMAIWLLAAPGSAQWVRVETPNFTVFGEVGEKRTREYAAEFERFREALGRLLPVASLRPAVPAMAVIFKDQRSFAPYRPHFHGKPIELSGYFSGGDSLNIIMLPATQKEAALQTIFHEYSHLVFANIGRGLPAWLGEGLAEYYSTFEISEDGRRATFGKPIERHLIRLNTERLMTLEELLAVDHDSPFYNEGSRRSTFYSQSWALVHMLLNGQPRRGKELNEYVKLVATGAKSATEAWKQVFPDPRIFEEFRRYIRPLAMVSYRITFEKEIEDAAFSVMVPAPADAQAALGDVLRHVKGQSPAAHMEKIQAATPFVQAIKGLVYLDEDKTEPALQHLLDATRSTTDWLVLYRAATGLERIVNSASRTETGRKAAAAALEALAGIVKQKPELPHALALRALVLGAGDEGLAALRRARELAPGHDHYSIWQAQFHLERREYPEARNLLAPLMSPVFPRDIRDYARSVMGQAVSAEQAQARAAERRAAGGDPAPQPGEQRAGPGRVQWVFRVLQPGEQRIEGTLERIECPRISIILHVREKDRVARFTADAFDDMEFLSYRDDLSGSVQCGPRVPPDPVYITFLPDPKGSDGRVVAVEFLPKR